MSKLYLLKSKDKNLVKIGISIDVLYRLRFIGDAVDEDQSLIYDFEDAKDARRLEKLLHLRFYRHRLTRLKGSGRTEWFSSEIIPSVIDELDRLREDFPMRGPSLLRVELDKSTPEPIKLNPHNGIWAPSYSRDGSLFPKEMVLAMVDHNCSVALRFERNLDNIFHQDRYNTKMHYRPVQV